MLALSIEAFAALGAPSLVYVRRVKAADVLSPQDASEFPPERILYALHGADGARLAIATDEASAVATALANELAPVSVH